MGFFVQSLHHEIEIDRRPDQVRAVLLDFAAYPAWQDLWTLEQVETKKPTDQLAPGDKILCVYRGSPVDGRVVVNTPECFSFSGALPVSVVLKGHHQYFLEKGSHGGTKLTLHEDFTGLFAFSLRRGSGSREYLERDYEKFNELLKRRVESMPA